MVVNIEAKRVIRLSRELGSLPIISYYLKLYGAEVLLGLEERDEETTSLVVQLLDEVEDFKNGTEDEGTKILLHDQSKALAFTMNFAMSLYNGLLVQIQDGKVDASVSQGLWCCIDLFQCCKHLWDECMDGKVKEQCDKRIKYAKYYLMKLKRGDLKANSPEPLASEEQSLTEQDEHDVYEISEGTVDAGGGPESCSSGEEKREFEHEYEERVVLKKSDSQISLPEVPSFVDEEIGTEPESGLLPPASFVDVPEIRHDIGPDSVKHTGLEKNEEKPQAHDIKSLQEIMSKEETINKAQRSAKYAISALNYDDIPTAKAELQSALKYLESL